MVKQPNKRVALEVGEPPRLGKVIFRQVILSDLELKNPLIDELIGVLRGAGFLGADEDAQLARLYFDEALVNAIRHGNKYDPSKRVTVTVSATQAKWNVLIEDEGEGFREEDVPDPDDPESLLLEGGRGILIMRSYLSRVTHYRGGSALLMEKFERRRDPMKPRTKAD